MATSCLKAWLAPSRTVPWPSMAAAGAQYRISQRAGLPLDCTFRSRTVVRWPWLLALCVALGLLVLPTVVLAQTPVAAPTNRLGHSRRRLPHHRVDRSHGRDGITAYDLRQIRSDAADKTDTNWTMFDDIWSSGSGNLIYTLGTSTTASATTCRCGPSPPPTASGRPPPRVPPGSRVR